MRERLDSFSESLSLGGCSVSDPHRPRPWRGPGGHLGESACEVDRTLGRALQAEGTGRWTWGAGNAWGFKGGDWRARVPEQ